MKKTMNPCEHERAAMSDIYAAIDKHLDNLTPAQLLGVIESIKLGLIKGALVESKNYEH